LQIGGEVADTGMRRQPDQILADGDDPSVVGRRGAEPDQAVLGAVERGDHGIALRRIPPGGVGLAVKEQRAVAGVFGIDVDLPGEDRRAHDVGRAEPDAAFDRRAPGPRRPAAIS